MKELLDIRKNLPRLNKLEAYHDALERKEEDLRAEQLAKYRAAYLDRLKATMTVQQLAVDRNPGS